MTPSDSIHSDLQTYFTERLATHGATFGGVDWNSRERQELCFHQLLRICHDPAQSTPARNFSLLDYGCGYGALAPYLLEKGYDFASYTGFDITPAMIEEAGKVSAVCNRCSFTANETTLAPADYVIGCGLLSLKMGYEEQEWERHALRLLDKLWSLTKKGLAFNSLTKYSDPERMRSDLYYPDPCFLFDYCKTRFAKNVSLLHDYGVYEFSILVRKEL